MNVISFSVRSSYSGFAICTSRIFLWDTDYQVVISDIDGTITKSVFPSSTNPTPTELLATGPTLLDTSLR